MNIGASLGTVYPLHKCSTVCNELTSISLIRKMCAYKKNYSNEWTGYYRNKLVTKT